MQIHIKDLYPRLHAGQRAKLDAYTNLACALYQALQYSARLENEAVGRWNRHLDGTSFAAWQASRRYRTLPKASV